MKIILINNLFGEYARGGAERVVATIANGLVDKGHEVVVISTRPFVESKVYKVHKVESQISNIQYPILYFFPWNIISYYNLHKLPTALKLLWHLINIFNVQSYFKIKKILKKEKPDIVMTHNLMGVGFLTPLAVKHAGVKKTASVPSNSGLRRVKHLHTLHDIQLLHPSGLMMVGREKKVDSWTARVYQWGNKKLFARADIVISPSRWLLDEHVRRGFFRKSKCVVMANPTTLCHSRESGNPDNDARDSRLRGNDNKQRNDRKKFVFLYVGQIAKHKGVKLLIEAFAQLTKGNCELWIVGSGTYNLQLTTYNSSNIQFLGKKSHNEVQSVMQQAHCLVVPSLCYENQPAVIREAQQNNLPVIASDIGGIPEILNHEFLFKAGDKESLKNKMQWVRENYQTLKIAPCPSMSAGDYIEKLFNLW